MDGKKQKVLIISHNPFSSYQSMGKTFESLFAAFDRSELCQIYIHSALPDVDRCNSIYRITDKDILRSYYKFRVEGKEITPKANNHSMYECEGDEWIYTNPKNKTAIRRLLRDMMWKIAPWYNKELKAWLDKEKPTCIFLAPGYAKFIYDIALKISENRGIPIITYICDDYYFVNSIQTLSGRVQLFLLRRKIRQIMRRTKIVVAISTEIAQKYSDEFLVDTELIMTGSNLGVANGIQNRETVNSFSYFGNIGVKREMALSDLGRTLDEINEKQRAEYRLKIYTMTQNSKMEAAFREIQSIQMCGFLTGEAFVQEFLNADCLVHVEAFDKESIDQIKGSISTKIADSLASGVPLLAYGPKGIASMEHLWRNECAFVANDYESLKIRLCEILNDNEKRRDISEKALSVAKRYHVSRTNSLHLKSLVEEIVGE